MALFDTIPNPSTCDPGKLKASEREIALQTINAIRSAHALPPVVYDPSGDREVMAASTLMAANGALSHAPPASWRCYTQEGADGAGSSNLLGGTISPYLGFVSTREEIIGWIGDVRNLMGGTGHRRWILSPFVTQISYGHVGWEDSTGNRTAASALKTFKFKVEAPIRGPIPDFVAYPYGDYPTEFYPAGALLSFSPVIDKIDRWNNLKVDLSQAKIHISSDMGDVAGTIVGRAMDAIGWCTTLEFRAGPLKPDVAYRVRVSGVRVAGKSIDYNYGFKLIGQPPS